MESNFRPAALFCILCGVVLIAGCGKEKQPKLPSTQAEPQAARLLVPPEIARQVELEPAWSYVVPLEPTERLKSFTILDDRLYAVTSRNYLVSMDRKDAQPVYSWQLASPIATLCGLKQYNGRLYSIVGADLLVLDAREGTKIKAKSIGFGPVCAPARNSSFFYVPAADRRVHVMQARDMVSLFEVSANDGGEITSVLATEDMVIFSTGAGTVAAMRPDEPVQLWRFRAAGGVNSPVVFDGKNVIFSSRDANIYMIDGQRGKLVWKYLTGALLTTAPAVTENYVYQHVDGGGLVAIEKDTGNLAWRLPDGISLLAEDGRKVYVMTKHNRLAVMDNKKLEKLYEVELPGVSRWITNTADDRIYLADDSGRVACIKPIKY